MEIKRKLYSIIPLNFYQIVSTYLNNKFDYSLWLLAKRYYINRTMSSQNTL